MRQWGGAIWGTELLVFLFLRSKGKFGQFFVFSKMEGLKIPPNLLPEMVKGFGVAGERSGAPLPRR